MALSDIERKRVEKTLGAFVEKLRPAPHIPTINAAGFTVLPAEVEAAMSRHPAIKECCIIASPDERRGETVKAVVLLKPEAEAISAEAIVEWMRTQMAAYKVPRKVEFIDALPRTASGKIQWRSLQVKEFR